MSGIIDMWTRPIEVVNRGAFCGLKEANQATAQTYGKLSQGSSLNANNPGYKMWEVSLILSSQRNPIALNGLENVMLCKACEV